MQKLSSKELPLISMEGYANTSKELNELIMRVEKELLVARLEMETNYEN